MTCVCPVDCWRCGTVKCDDGVTSPRLVFSHREAVEYFLGLGFKYLCAIEAAENVRLSMPCGKCEACQIRKRKDMSVRLANEVQCHDDCCFITLTYNDDNIPFITYDGEVGRGFKREWSSSYTLLPRDVQLFIKRLRRHLEYKPKFKKGVRDYAANSIRYFCVGEYGGRTHRPHYHLIIFGWKPSDQVIHQVRKGYTINRSAQIEKLWHHGFSTVANVNVGVAKYCARYVTKKFNRSKTVRDPFILPEFTLQSTRNGGIGSTWLHRYKANLKHGFVNVRNGETISKCSIPRYYYDRLRKIDLPLWLELRDQRLEFVLRRSKPIDFDEVWRKIYQERLNDAYALTKEQI